MTADSVGGVWTYAAELARGLADRGIEILLVSSGGPLTDAQRSEIEVLPHVRLVETRSKLEWMDDAWNDVEALGRRLLELAAEFRPDVVHLNEYSHAALDWRVPKLVVGHSCVFSWFESVRGQAPGPEWERYRRSVTSGLRAADVVVAPTQFMLDALRRHYGPLHRATVISNGLTRSGGQHAQPPKEPFVFAAGRWWDEAKNIASLGRVAASVPWPIKVAGLPSPEGHRTDLPAGVVSLGRLSSDEMSEQYARAAIYCLPARYEPFGLTPLEAASAGCALVLGDTPSLREVWDDAATFVSPTDDSAIASRLTELIADEAARTELARRGRARAALFSRSRMAEAYSKLYRELVKERVASIAESFAGGVR
ncbi:MAG: glycosyltransferase family 4 protein [Planctomycetaceae bacterium]|nr:glycosyltransferase family 4 protein [Planctomycetaceae bacterium]